MKVCEWMFWCILSVASYFVMNVFFYFFSRADDGFVFRLGASSIFHFLLVLQKLCILSLCVFCLVWYLRFLLLPMLLSVWVIQWMRCNQVSVIVMLLGKFSHYFAGNSFLKNNKTISWNLWLNTLLWTFLNKLKWKNCRKKIRLLWWDLNHDVTFAKLDALTYYAPEQVTVRRIKRQRF